MKHRFDLVLLALTIGLLWAIVIVIPGLSVVETAIIDFVVGVIVAVVFFIVF